MEDIQAYIKRRNKLLNSINKGIAIIPNNDEIKRSQDSNYPYSFDNYFYYLTGFKEPKSVLILDFIHKKSILFCRDKDQLEERWEGIRFGVEKAKEVLQVDEAYPISNFNAKLSEYLQDVEEIYYALGEKPSYDDIIIEAVKRLRRLTRSGINAANTIININSVIDEMRLIKDEWEITQLKIASQISVQAHIEVMQNIKNMSYEYEVHAKLMEVFYRHNTTAAYECIIGGGKNACILHYIQNNEKLNPNELLLIDAGCVYNGYVSDLTRTFPVSGKFSKAQRAIYEIVLEANKEAIKEVKIGNSWDKPNQATILVLTQGLIDIGLLSGSVEENIERETYKQFYMHRFGHWLGLDVHDVGKYKINNEWRKFEHGMCTTVEPGLYISPSANVPQEYWNIGVRIEDNILLDKSENIYLNYALPKEVDDIEKLINSH